MTRRFRIAIVAAGLVTAIGLPLVPASAAGTSTISGVAFQDTNRNGVMDPGEAPMQGHVLYAFDANGNYVASATTASDGTYAFTGLAAATYKIAYSTNTWWSLRDAWVPTTTGSLQPEVTVSVNGASTVPFGWRQIVRSADPSAPISSYTGPQGLVVRSYNDAVDARTLYDALMTGALVGKEASAVVVRFGLASAASTTSSATKVGNSYTSYSATVDLDYTTYLDSGDRTLFHEYGHAWSMYYAYLVQGDPTLSAYIAKRGLAGDSRVGSSYAWSPGEMIAEDYRQLFGSATSRTWAQMNTDIPTPDAVPGLRDWLSGAFMTTQASTSTTPAPAPALAVSGLSISPVPVTTSGTVTFSTNGTADLTVTITSRGTLVRKLAATTASPAGAYSFVWNKTDDRGRTVKKGTYAVQVQATSSIESTSASYSFNVG